MSLRADREERREARRAWRKGHGHAKRRNETVERIIAETALPRSLIQLVFGPIDIDNMAEAKDNITRLKFARFKLRQHLADVLDVRTKLNHEITRLEDEERAGTIISDPEDAEDDDE